MAHKIVAAVQPTVLVVRRMLGRRLSTELAEFIIAFLLREHMWDAFRRIQSAAHALAVDAWMRACREGVRSYRVTQGMLHEPVKPAEMLKEASAYSKRCTQLMLPSYWTEALETGTWDSARDHWFAEFDRVCETDEFELQWRTVFDAAASEAIDQ